MRHLALARDKSRRLSTDPQPTDLDRCPAFGQNDLALDPGLRRTGAGPQASEPEEQPSEEPADIGEEGTGLWLLGEAVGAVFQGLQEAARAELAR